MLTRAWMVDEVTGKAGNPLDKVQLANWDKRSGGYKSRLKLDVTLDDLAELRDLLNAYLKDVDYVEST